MKKFSLVLALALLAFLPAPAQQQVMTLDLSLSQNQFLPAETLPVTIHLYNNSGQTLHLGVNNEWLTFTVQSLDDNNTSAINGSQPPVTGAFDLGSSEVATKHVDIEPYFNLKQTGRYSVTAYVHIPEWNMDVTSPAKEFDIVSGVELWSQEFGVPMPAGVSNRPPEVRKYALEEANYLQKQLKMYLMVTDASGRHIFKVAPVGDMVSFSRPEAQLDSDSNLHLLYQNGGETFLYTVADPDGNILRQDIYDYINSRPHLSLNDAGQIVVLGGSLRAKPGSIPVIIPPNEPAAPAKQ